MSKNRSFAAGSRQGKEAAVRDQVRRRLVVELRLEQLVQRHAAVVALHLDARLLVDAVE